MVLLQQQQRYELVRWLIKMMKKIFRGRLGRSQSKGRVIETAFVSQTQSSTEDLDEVDRLANHPVLRPHDADWLRSQHRLRKSRSETGGSVDRGLWTSVVHSNQSSPMGAASSGTEERSGFGSRIVGVSMLKRRSKKPVSRMKRSYTVDFAAAQAEDSPSSSLQKERLASPQESPESPEHDEYAGVPVRRPSNHLVTAIIEARGTTQSSEEQKEVVKKSSSLASKTSMVSANSDMLEHEGEDDIITISEECGVVRHVLLHEDPTPPNSAPLPSKFGNGGHPPPVHNLLRVQLQKKTIMDCDTSSAASTTEVTSPVMKPMMVEKTKLALPLKQRLMFDSSQDDSSSSDGTPQRRSKEAIAASSTTTSASAAATTTATSTSCSSGTATTKTPALASAASSSLCKSRPLKPNAPLLGRKMQKSSHSKFILNLSAESESCSSAMSSMESVRSSNSSVHSLISSSESGAGMSTSSNSNLSLPMTSKPMLELRTHRSNMLTSSKFQVLSPISDKSQEQSSEQGDGQSASRTPKVSPTDHILSSCCGVQNVDDSENNNLQHQEPAPFSMPKLQRRLVQQKQQYYQNSLMKKANAGIQGSDSGISMSSQDVQDMVELLKLPFDMPKLRRKTQHILGRPQSMPSSQITVVARNTIETYQRRNNETASSSSDLHEAWPGPKPCDVGSTMDNYHFQRENNAISAEAASNSCDNDNKSGSADTLPHPAPPPGFADENNRFYLTEEDMDSNTLAPSSGNNGVQNLSMRRRKKQMTLSFGLDPKQTLMFSTNDPFHLNDCQEIDANLPLEKQEWYHGGISKAEAEDSLRHQDEGAYLVRNVDLRRQEFSLVLKSAKGFMHMRIKRDMKSRQFQLSDFSRTFLTIPDMVHHYTRNRLPIKGAEHACLKKPIAIQLL